MLAEIFKTRNKPVITAARSAEIEGKAQQKHEAAKARVEQCRRDLADAMLADAAAGAESTAIKARKALETAMADESAAATLLEAAGAIRTSALDGERVSARKANLAMVKSHLDARDQAAERLSAAIAEAVRHWQAMIDESAKAVDGYRGSWPRGGLMGPGEMKYCVERELFRCGAVREHSEKSFPGGRAHDLNLIDNAPAIPALPDVIKQTSAFIMAEITKGTGHA